MNLDISLKGVLKIAHLRVEAEILAMQDAYTDVGGRTISGTYCRTIASAPFNF